MTAAENSFVGLAKQTGKGTPNVTDNLFDYFLFSEGGIGPQNMVIPLDQEVGGGALLRGMAKVGVTASGAFNFIPRPKTLGNFLYAAFGTVSAPAVQGATTAYQHTFTLGANQFAAPYFTFRANPGGLWGETFQDCRIAALSLNWKAADYLRAALAVQGGLPTPNVSTAAWSAAAKVDGSPQFLAPLFSIELPTATPVKCLGGQVTMGMNIPMEEQWITGSYSPDDFDINSRMFSISLALKITDATLYNKMSYDPAAGSAWTAAILREANFKLLFKSDVEAGVGHPYSLDISANGQTGANANVMWSCQPVALRAGRQVTLAATGVFVANPQAGEPITAKLINQKSTAYSA